MVTESSVLLMKEMHQEMKALMKENAEIRKKLNSE